MDAPRASVRPQPPPLRKRDLNGGQGKLVGAGKKIAAPAQLVSARGSLSARSSGAPEQPLATARGSGRSRATSPSQASQASESSSRPQELGADAPLGQNDGNADIGSGAADALELAKGGEALLRRLADVSSTNMALRRQLDAQSQDISLLENSGKVQQQMLKDFERKVDQMRQQEALAAESRLRAEASEREAQLRSELEECRNKARQEKEELMERLHASNSERAQREGERDEARARASSLETRLNAALATGGHPPVHAAGPTGPVAAAPLHQVAAVPAAAVADAALDGPRLSAMEMELNLVRSRFVRETTMRQAAEKAAADVQREERRLRGELERLTGEARQLRRELAKQSEQVSFGQECCQDLQTQLRQQQAQAEQRLNRERGRFAAVNRLEGVLPKHVLMKALT